MNWLPTEGEKVEFIEGLGVHSNLIPRRIYYGAVRAQKRYFALKLPVAGGDKTVTFAYVDPGRETTGELNSWGAAHGPLWDAIRAKGRRVEVIAIGAELDAVLRADRVLQLWAAAEPGKVATGLTVKQEIELLERALDRQDLELFDQYGGMQEAINRYIALGKLPEAELAEGVSIDDYSTFRATRFRSRFEGPIRGVFHAAGGRLFFAAGTKGGVRHKKAWGWNIPTFLELLCFPWFAHTIRLP